MSWQLLTLISVLSLSVAIILQRVLLHKNKIDPFAYAVIFQGIVGVLLMVAALGAGFKLPGIETMIVPAILSIVLFGIGHIVYAKTLQKVEASAFSILFATQAIWIMILGIALLQESLTILQVLGTVLIFLSVGLLVKRIGTVFQEKGVWLGLLTGLLFGIATAAWSYVGRYTDTLSWAAISFVVTALVTFLVRPKSIKKIKPLLKSKVLLILIVLAVFYGIGSLAMLYAYKEGTFALVSPLRQTGIIVTVLLALVFLPTERNRIGRKILAALICTIGVVLIVL